MNLITERPPPPNRLGRHDGPFERHLLEPAVMLAIADWLFEQDAPEVRIYPDGMHMKSFDIPAWLVGHGFTRMTTTGRGQISGTFRRGDQALIVHSQPGRGDVVGTLNGVTVQIETKGGCINTRHPGQVSSLRKGLHEAVGQLLGSPRDKVRLIAAVPRHPATKELATRVLLKCALVGIEIALVDGDGSVELLPTAWDNEN
jgi:hypothetical protein